VLAHAPDYQQREGQHVSMSKILTAARLITADQQIEKPILLLDGPSIRSIGSRDDRDLPPGEHIDYPGATLTAAYFDVHIHGCCGLDVMAATGPVLTTIGSFLAKHGVGSYFPTTITAPKDATLRSLSGLAALIDQPNAGARPRGIHIEGPFLSHIKKGAHPAQDLLLPSVEFFDRMWEASAGNIRLMTIAPELPGALEVIARAKQLGVRVSLGHSNATVSEAEAGVAAGADSATHTFNAMRNFDQREPGILGVVLSEDTLYAELICDGLHVHPRVVPLFYRDKGPDRAILITDAISATGMPDGTYKLGDLEVRLVEGRCLIGENTLAGSTITLAAAVRNFSRFTGAPLEIAVRLASRNPARMAGLDTGELREGGAADIVVLSPEGVVVDTWLSGNRIP
jgi:N-acetylglucosamine-6-phosphate deacetylase